MDAVDLVLQCIEGVVRSAKGLPLHSLKGIDVFSILVQVWVMWDLQGPRTSRRRAALPLVPWAAACDADPTAALPF